MRYTDTGLRQMLAGEYVLGTLRGRARLRFQRLLVTDPGLRAEVRYWEVRLAGLAHAPAPVKPPDIVWERLSQRLGLARRRPAAALRLGLWRAWAGLATAASLVLAVALYLEMTREVPMPLPVTVEVPVPRDAYVAALQLADEEALWSLTLIPDTRTLRLAAVGDAQLPGEQDYELWWLGDEGVISLGLLPRSGEAAREIPADVRLVPSGKVAVSLEPAGGSPTGQPTGPVLLATALLHAG